MLPELPISRERAVHEARRILEHMDEMHDPSSKMRVHASLFGPQPFNLDEESVASDLAFVQQKLKGLMERVI